MSPAGELAAEDGREQPVRRRAEPAPIRLLLVDDQDLVRFGLRMAVNAQPDLLVAAEAADGRAALDQACRHEVDVVLMDIRMPRMNGIDATAAMTSQFPATKVLALTTFDLDEYAFGALRAGAAGFLLKDAQPEELFAAIRAVAAGDAMLAPRVTRRMIELFGRRLPPAPDGDSQRLSGITPREHEVLIAVAAGLSNAEIAQQLFLSESTVKTHIGRVLAKLGLRDRVHIVIYAYERGLV